LSSYILGTVAPADGAVVRPSVGMAGGMMVDRRTELIEPDTIPLKPYNPN
jgi:hypothetical protein